MYYHGDSSILLSHLSKRISDSSINYYIKDISLISYKMGTLLSRTLSLDNEPIVSHQWAWGVLFCDVSFAIDCHVCYSNLCVFLNYSVVYQHI